MVPGAHDLPGPDESEEKGMMETEKMEQIILTVVRVVMYSAMFAALWCACCGYLS